MKIFSITSSTLLPSAALIAGLLLLQRVVAACGPDESVLLVRVKMDRSVYQNSWVLELQQQHDDWIEVATDSFKDTSILYEDALCLQPDSTYRWTIFDTFGDGIHLCTAYLFSPIEVLFNDEMILEDFGNQRWSSLEVTFLTPSDPDSGQPAVIFTESPSESPSSSENPFASIAPTDGLSEICGLPNCGDDVQVLEIYVQTGYNSFQNEWILEKQDDDGGWEEVASNPLEEQYEKYFDRVCLEPSTTYRWTITDTNGDGDVFTDEYALFVDNEQFFQEDSNSDWFSLDVIFVTPSDPSGPLEILTASPSISPTAAPTGSNAPSDTPTESSAPSSGPSFYQCGEDDQDLLIINVDTDSSLYENSWVLDEKDPITSDYFQIASNYFNDRNTVYEDKICLEQGVLYRWTLTDDRGRRPGNGFNCPGINPDCGYSVKLNGEEIVSNGRMFDEVVKEIGPVDCSEDVRGFHRVVNPRPGRNKFKRVYCNGLRKLIRKTESNEGCFAKLIDGSGYLYDKCKRICGRAGAGPCAPA